MKLEPTRRTDYAIRALVYLVHHSDGRSKSTEISGAMEIPQSYLPQLLQSLNRAGLISSQAGQHGGYELTRPPNEVSILDVVQALEGSIEDGECAMVAGPCHWDNVCPLHWVWSSARSALVEELRNATLEQVAGADLSLFEGTAKVPADSHRRRIMG